MPHSRSRRPASLAEFQLIETLRRRYGATGPNVVQGIGDDAAVVTPIKGHELVVTTDLLVEGVHFDHKTATLQDIGYKAAVASLSDVAAMGARPDYLLVSLAIPSSRTPSDIQQLYRGLMLACRPHEVALIGGDTSASPQGLFINIVLIGNIKAGRALTRDGARVGDLIYVTGTLGDSLAGLRLVSNRKPAPDIVPKGSRGAAQKLIRRHLRPTPRLTTGQILSEQRLATSAIDLSDGLSGDLRRICEQSQVGAEIDADALPISAALRQYAERNAVDPVEMALEGGEDYELAFTVAPRHRKHVEQLVGQIDGGLACIGIIKSQAYGLRITDHVGSVRHMPNLSYQHFHSTPTTHPEGS